MKDILLVSLIVLLCSCGHSKSVKVKHVSYYLQHDKQREAKIAEYEDNLDQMEHDAGYINAVEAKRRVRQRCQETKINLMRLDQEKQTHKESDRQQKYKSLSREIKKYC